MHVSTLVGLLLGALPGQQQPVSYPEGVWLDLAGEPEGHGLEFIDTSFGDDTPTPAETGGRECHVVGPGQSWFRLQVDPAFMGEDDEADVTLGIEYYDNGTGPIQFAYDCADQARLVGGRWATEFPRCRTGTDQWQTLWLCLPRARFRRNQNGADLAVGRHAGGPPQYLYVSRMSITRAFLDVEATPPAICLDDRSDAELTIDVRGPGGQPAPDGTQVELYCEQGVVPAAVETKGGTCSAKTAVTAECGEARIEVQSPWSAREFRLPVLAGGGGIAEVRWPLLDFERYEPGDEVFLQKRPAEAEVSGMATHERSHGGDAALRVTYAFPDGTGDAILPVDSDVPGYTRGFEVHAITELDWPPEIRLRVEDASGETFHFAGQLPEKRGEWLRYWISLLDPLAPGYSGDENQRPDQPLFLSEVGLAARSTHKLAPGTIDLDDIAAITWMAQSEVPEGVEVLRQVYPTGE